MTLTPTPTQVGHLVQLINERLDPNYDGVITREELKLLKQSRLIGTSSVVNPTLTLTLTR